MPRTKTKKKLSSNSYKDAGVDIDAGNELVKRITPLANSTSREGAISSLGGFGALFDLKAAGYDDPILVAATDGVGTKLKIAIDAKILNFVGIDLVAMCVNDLICQGAEPLFFLDYLSTGKLDVKLAEQIVTGIVAGCKEAKIALIGGETAEMPGMYQKEEFDLAGFAVGALNRGKELPNNIEPGDIIIGLASSGVHSNGYSLVRRIFKNNGLDLNSPSPFSKHSFGRDLLEPTKIYVSDILRLINCDLVKGAAHITGGGITENLPRVLSKQLGAQIDVSSWPLLNIFKWLFEKGSLDQGESLKTFNCGIGMIIIVSKEKKPIVLKMLNKKAENAFDIGKITNSGRVEFFGKFK